jgi:glycosyltransferase involved in cell wall biosynthesis
MKKILLIGPIAPPVTGQSVAFTEFVSSLDPNFCYVINTNLTGSNIFKKLLFSLILCFKISFKVYFSKFDVVYFTCSRSFLGSFKDVALLFFVNKYKTRVINHLHGSDFKSFLSNSNIVYRRLLFHCYKKVDVSIVLLSVMVDEFIDFPSMDVYVVPNFYDKSLSSNNDYRKYADSLISKPINLLYLSNIVYSKGIFDLINAYKIVKINNPSISLTIAGNFLSDELMSKKEVREEFYLSISSTDIKFVGSVYGDEKRDLLCSSDVFVLPSFYTSEAFPISIIEAMVTGNAIITTKFKYLPTIVSPSSGLVVPTNSPLEISEALNFLINEPNCLAEMKKYNVSYSKLNFSHQNYIDSLNNIVFADY